MFACAFYDMLFSLVLIAFDGTALVLQCVPAPALVQPFRRESLWNRRREGFGLVSPCVCIIIYL